MFSHTKFQIGINICHLTFLQCLQIKPHFSSLTNVENQTSNFCQSVQICRGEKEREENNGNCKAFCVIRKRNKCLLQIKISLQNLDIVVSCKNSFPLINRSLCRNNYFRNFKAFNAVLKQSLCSKLRTKNLEKRSMYLILVSLLLTLNNFFCVQKYYCVIFFVIQDFFASFKN